MPPSVLRSTYSATTPVPLVVAAAVKLAVIVMPRYLSVLLSTVLDAVVPVVADTLTALISVCSVLHVMDPSDANFQYRALTVTVIA